MSKVILISCVSLKRNVKCEAQYLYISPLFVKSLQYAKLQNPDKIFILSAKYGLVKCDDIIEPYNVTLKNFSKKEKLVWEKNVINSLQKETNLKKII